MIERVNYIANSIGSLPCHENDVLIENLSDKSLSCQYNVTRGQSWMADISLSGGYITLVQENVGDVILLLYYYYCYITGKL